MIYAELHPSIAILYWNFNRKIDKLLLYINILAHLEANIELTTTLIVDILFPCKLKNTTLE